VKIHAEDGYFKLRRIVKDHRESCIGDDGRSLGNILDCKMTNKPRLNVNIMMSLYFASIDSQWR
jgi:hypothetical protein